MKIIAGNWKMNGNPEKLTEIMSELDKISTKNRVILCVPYTMLRSGNASVLIGAQNVSRNGGTNRGVCHFGWSQ